MNNFEYWFMEKKKRETSCKYTALDLLKSILSHIFCSLVKANGLCGNRYFKAACLLLYPKIPFEKRSFPLSWTNSHSSLSPIQFISGTMVVVWRVHTFFPPLLILLLLLILPTNFLLTSIRKKRF